MDLFPEWLGDTEGNAGHHILEVGDQEEHRVFRGRGSCFKGRLVNVVWNIEWLLLDIEVEEELEAKLDHG